MKVELRNPSGLDAVADVSFDAAIDGQIAQPYRVDWGDGTPIQSVAGGSPLATHTYVKAGFYKVTVACNNSTSNQTLRVGSPAYPAPGATFERTQEVLREDTAAVLGTTSKLG
jgi:PKD repeat protein